MRIWKIAAFLVLFLVMLLSACGEKEEVPPPQPRNTVDANQPTAPPAVITQIVTRTPLPTALPSITATFAYDMRQLEGSWVLIMSLATTHEDVLGTINYSTTAGIEILASGAVVGTGRFTSYVEYSECPVSTNNEGEGKPYRVQGQLTPNGDGTTATLELTLVPDDPDAIEQFVISCDTQSNNPREAVILWPLLAENNLLTLQFDMSEYVHSQLIESENLTGDLYFGK